MKINPQLKNTNRPNERSSADLYCMNKQKKENIKKQVKLWDFLWIPGFSAVFFTILPFIVSEFLSRFAIIFLFSFGTFVLMFFIKKQLGVPNGEFGQKIVEITIKSSLSALGLSIYISLFFYGEIQPLFLYDPIENVLIVGLTTLYINLGMWGLIWLLAIIMSFVIIKKTSPVKKPTANPVT